MDGLNIHLVRDESKEVRQIELQLLEGANARLSHSQGSNIQIETEHPLEGYKPNEWQKLDRIICATIRMHLSESVYFTMQSCSTDVELEDTIRHL